MITNRKGATAQRWMMIVIAGVVGIGLLTGIFFFLGNLLPKAEMESAGTYCASGTGQKAKMQISFQGILEKLEENREKAVDDAEMEWTDIAVAFIPVYGQVKTAQNLYKVAKAAGEIELIDATIGGFEGLQERVTDIANSMTDNFPNRCTRRQTERIEVAMNADQLSYFLYQASINAFYSLHGSTENAVTGLTENAMTGFDIFEITAKVNGPGTFLMDGLCTKWIDESVEDSRVISNPASNNKCNITVSFVDESTMILAAMERCMNARDRDGRAGPESGACLCFVKEALTGKPVYSDANGLGNSEISVQDNERISPVIKTDAFSDYNWGDGYLGCGAEPEPFIFNVSDIGGDRIKWKSDGIQQGIFEGNSKILLFHLIPEGNAIEIEQI
jgi:hypothetical protein